MSTEFYGNEKTPLAQTLKELQVSSKSSGVGNFGDFFAPTHERDPHTKSATTNKDGTELEFNASCVVIQNSEQMHQYIQLNNFILSGECFLVDETQTVDRETGEVTIFIKWLQPKGFMELGSLNKTISASKLKELQELQTAKVAGTSPSAAPPAIVGIVTPQKGKGTLKANRKAKHNARTMQPEDLLNTGSNSTNTKVSL